jgi:Tfp pilus assembly protein PilN
MEAVNLLPAYARPAGRWSTVGKELAPARVIKLGGIAAAACAVAIGGMYFYERSIVSDRNATLTDTKARLAAVEATAAPLRAAETASAARMTVVRTVAGSRVSWETVLRDLSRVLPDQVYLQSLQVQSATAVSATAGAASVPATLGVVPTAFTITGIANSHARVALVLDRLALLPWLSDPTLQSSLHSAGTTGKAGGDQFTIGANFSAPTQAGAGQ